MPAFWLALLAALSGGPKSPSPERRALDFLAREVPRWARENRCYSCHNNGDAARALYRATRLGYVVPEKALADTTRWLARPAGWEHNGGEGEFNDKKLARLQFAAALREAAAAGRVKDRAALRESARLVTGLQGKDGSWPMVDEDSIGSPATYGPGLATYLGRRVLQGTDPKQYREAVARADRWFRRVPVKNVTGAAAVLLGLGTDSDEAARGQRHKCLALLRKGQGEDGGWGPYVDAASEPFDTAVVLLALRPLAGRAEVRAMLRRGRAYLVKTQNEDGGWRETTRPAGRKSYAQRISTTGWVTLALLETREE